MNMNGNDKKSYKQIKTFEYRLKESSSMHKKYDNKLCIIVEKSKTSSENTPNIDKRKYLVPDDLTLGNFSQIIRKRLKMSPSESLILFVAGSNLIPVHEIMSNIYKEHADPDGFLYISYTKENTFG